jgi:hypothetical protein
VSISFLLHFTVHINMFIYSVIGNNSTFFREISSALEGPHAILEVKVKIRSIGSQSCPKEKIKGFLNICVLTNTTWMFMEIFFCAVRQYMYVSWGFVHHQHCVLIYRVTAINPEFFSLLTFK